MPSAPAFAARSTPAAARAGVVGGPEAGRGPEVLDVGGLGVAGAFVLAVKGDRAYAPLLL
ncbi:hypothetical protein ACWEQP_25095 [Streptomyces sp. NPDC004044]